MNKTNIRVAVSGASGRMGRQVIHSLLSHRDVNNQLVVLTGAITNSNSEYIGNDVGKLIGVEPCGVIVHDSIEYIVKDFDILIDFSNSQATLQYLHFCSMNNKDMVIGTTGFTKEELLFIRKASKNIGVVFSPNFSVMVTVMLKLLEQSSRVFDQDTYIEIFEVHHKNKVDIPSGTALMMRKVIKSSLEFSLLNKETSKKHDLKHHQDTADSIKINATRAGDNVGEHSVYFVNMGERLEIVHRAFDRSIFARGAIHSAIWLRRKKRVGLFSMSNVLGLDCY